MSVVAIVVAVSALVCAVSAVRVGAKPSNCDVCQAVADAAHM